jgi:hypothetical protein
MCAVIETVHSFNMTSREFYSLWSIYSYANMEYPRTMFLKLLCSWRPFELALSVWPPRFVDIVTYEKKLLYFHIVNLNIRIYLYYFCLNYCIVVFLFGHNTFSTYASKNNLLKFGVIFSVFLGRDEHLQFLNVRLQCVSDKRSSPLLNIKTVTYLRQQISRPNETRFNQIGCGKSNKIPLRLLCCWELDSILNLK